MIAGLTTYNIKDIIDTVEHPCVYVFFDTCALLHLLKIETHQSNSNVNIFAHYEELYNLIHEGKVIALASIMNYIELESNYNSICQDFGAKYNKTIKYAQPIINLAHDKGKIAEVIDFNSLSVLEYAKDLYNRITLEIKYLKERLCYDRFAMIRVKQSIVPAHKKHEYKDAYIWKTCLDVKSKSKKNDYIIFFTTNTEDFVPDEGTEAKEQLIRDCGKKVKIITNINALIPKLKIKLGMPLT